MGGRTLFFYPPFFEKKKKIQIAETFCTVKRTAGAPSL
jgi:hypothetical protein